jgi:hypothetical protein
MNAPTVAASSLPGPASPAYVICTAYTNQLSLQPWAGPQAGKTSQRIYYRYYLHDDSANVWVSGWSPSSYGSWVSQPYGTNMTPGPTTVLTFPFGAADHYFSVWTEYLWDTGATTILRTTSFRQYGYIAYQTACRV